MRYALRQVAPPEPCAYLPDRLQRMEYIVATSVSAAEYQALMEEGWRHFGHLLFRPVCPECLRCRSVRVDAARFVPTRGQKRVIRRNSGVLEPVFAEPDARPEVIALHHSWHRARAARKGWDDGQAGEEDGFRASFANQPFRVEQWEYRLQGKLVGVGYVDALPRALSAIYFFYDMAVADRSPGIWNVLRLLAEARHRGIPHVYLGYLVEGNEGMAYKGRFHPAEYHEREKPWRPLGPGAMDQ